MNNSTLKEIVTRYPENISFPFADLYDEMGYKVLEVLSDEFGGTYLYIPTKKRMFKGCIEKEIQKSYNGYNVKELSKRFEYSDRTIRGIIYKTSLDEQN